MQRICVFCGSSPGARPEYLQVARELGYALAHNGIGLVYGGGNVGLMGEIAKAVLEKDGDVIGVIPQALLQREVALVELEDLRVVSSMHERKALMAELSDGFIAMPGGLGTIEEFVEVLTWAQLGIHDKPCGLLNICQYYDTFTAFLDYVTKENFVQQGHRDMVLIDENPQSLIDQLQSYLPPDIDKTAWALQMKN